MFQLYLLCIQGICDTLKQKKKKKNSGFIQMKYIYMYYTV